MVTYMEKYLDTAKPRYSEQICQSLGTSLNQGFTVSFYTANLVNKQINNKSNGC